MKTYTPITGMVECQDETGEYVLRETVSDQLKQAQEQLAAKDAEIADMRKAVEFVCERFNIEHQAFKEIAEKRCVQLLPFIKRAEAAEEVARELRRKYEPKD